MYSYVLPFKEWILCFINVDRPIGDFAVDVAKDDNFPEDSFEEIFEYLSNKGASANALATFRHAWTLFILEQELKDRQL